MAATAFWRTTLVLSLLGAVNSNLAFNDDDSSSVFWKINTSPPSYLFGTMHVPYTWVWDAIPENVKVAFNRSTHLFTEVELNGRKGTFKLLPNGQNISEILPKFAYVKYKRYLQHIRTHIGSWLTPEQKRQGINASNVFDKVFGKAERMLPIWAAVLVSQTTQRSVATHDIPVLDTFLTQQAILQNKSLGGLETSKDRIRAMENVGLPGQIQYLSVVLRDFEEIPASELHAFYDERLDSLVAEYRRRYLSASTRSKREEVGDSKTEVDKHHILAKLLEEYEGWMVQERSRNMGLRIVEILKATRNSGESQFFAVGGAHYSGKHRIQKIVREAGFRVDQLDDIESL